jgi:tetratricopeptide (TPR) repeat protein
MSARPVGTAVAACSQCAPKPFSNTALEWGCAGHVCWTSRVVRTPGNGGHPSIALSFPLSLPATAGILAARSVIVSLFRLWPRISAAAMCLLSSATAELASAEPDDFAARLMTANGLWETGDQAGAEKVLLTALREAESVSKDEIRRATVLSKLGSAYHFQGRYTAAERCYLRAISIWKNRRERNGELVRSLGNLAALYGETGRYSKADRLELRAVVARPSEFGLDDADAAWLLATLGVLEYRRERYAHAERDQNAALAISDKLAPHAPEITQILNNLGLIQLRTRRYAEALSSYRRAVGIAETAGNPDYSMQALLLANIGTTHLLMSGPWEAEPFYTRALAVAEKRLGSAHPLVGRILSCYAVVLRQTKRKANAKTVERHARAILQAQAREGFSHMVVHAGDLLQRR